MEYRELKERYPELDTYIKLCNCTPPFDFVLDDCDATIEEMCSSEVVDWVLKKEIIDDCIIPLVRTEFDEGTKAYYRAIEEILKNQYITKKFIYVEVY